MIKTIYIVLLICFIDPGVTDYKIGEPVEMMDLTETRFYEISDFVIYHGRFYVADSQVSKLYLFSESGALINETGRSGRGPGEYEMGPHRIVPFDDELKVVDYFLTHINVYDKELNYTTTREDNLGLRSADFIHNVADNLYLVKRMGYDHQMSVFYANNKGTKELDFGFEIMPGLLYRYDIHRIGKQWLFYWYYQNRFELFDDNFKPVDQFKIEGLPDVADGIYTEHNFNPPPHADSIQAKVIKAGAFAPSGSFFESVTVLNDVHFIVQLGDQTGGRNQALILNKAGSTVQEIELPVNGIILTHYGGNLFIYSEDEMSVIVYPIYSYE